jgi:hypothetical protein
MSEVPRFFIAVKSYGVADAKGKTLIGIEVTGKRAIAPPDAPMSLMVALLEDVIGHHHYTSKEAAEKDFERLKTFAANLVVLDQ